MVEYQYPYFYCEKCKRLAPTESNDFGYVECMVCRVFVTTANQRPVFLDRKEAKLRGLAVVNPRGESNA